MNPHHQNQNNDYLTHRLEVLAGSMPKLPADQLRLEYAREEIERTLARIEALTAEHLVAQCELKDLEGDYHRARVDLSRKQHSLTYFPANTYYQNIADILIKQMPLDTHQALKMLVDRWNLPIQLVFIEGSSDNQPLNKMRIVTLSSNGFQNLTDQELIDAFPRQKFGKENDKLRPAQRAIKIRDGIRSSGNLVIKRKDSFESLLDRQIISDWDAAKRQILNKYVEQSCAQDVVVLNRAMQAYEQLKATYEACHRPSVLLYDKLKSDYIAGVRIVKASLSLANKNCQPEQVKNAKYGYHISIDNQLLLKINENGEFVYFSSPNKRTPFTLKTFTEDYSLTLAKRWCELAPGDFVTENGLKLVGAKLTKAQEIFSYLEDQWAIFPLGDVEQIVIAARKLQQKSSNEPLQARTWGQELLANAKPEKWFAARLFNDSSIGWQIFQFGGFYVVEADCTNHATYIVKGKTGLELIKKHSRNYIARHRPEGYVGRVFHAGEDANEREQWVAKIKSVIGGENDFT